MASMGSFSAAGLKNLQKQLNKIQQGNVEAFIEECAKELAARLLAKVIKRTPVGVYPKSSGITVQRRSISKIHSRSRKQHLKNHGLARPPIQKVTKQEIL